MTSRSSARQRRRRCGCRARVPGRRGQLDLGDRPLELELGDAFDGRAGRTAAGSARARSRRPRARRAARGPAVARPVRLAGRGGRAACASRAGAAQGRPRDRTAAPGGRRTRARPSPREAPPPGGAAAGVPRGSTTSRRAPGSSLPGRTRCDQPVTSVMYMLVERTKPARSARASTRGSWSASSPETISAPISPSAGGSSPRPSPAERQAPATPRPFGVRGRK